MNFEDVMTVKEYCELTGMYGSQTGYITRQLNAGKPLPGIKRARKSGGTWLVMVETKAKQ